MEFYVTNMTEDNNQVENHQFQELEGDTLPIWEEPRLPFYLTSATLGLFCNSLATAVMVKQNLIKDGVWMFLNCLAICDNLMLISNFIYEYTWQQAYLEIDLAKSEIFCKLIPCSALSLTRMNGPRRTACFAKEMHSYTLLTLKWYP